MTLTGVNFSGYGADGTTSAALHIKRTGGTVTINISGASAPTYKSDGATVNIESTVTVKVTVKDAASAAVIQDARVFLKADAGGDLAEGTQILNALSNASGIVQDTGFQYTNPQPVLGRVRKGTATPLYKTSPISGTIIDTGFNVLVFLVKDE